MVERVRSAWCDEGGYAISPGLHLEQLARAGIWRSPVLVALVVVLLTGLMAARMHGGALPTARLGPRVEEDGGIAGIRRSTVCARTEPPLIMASFLLCPRWW